MIMPASWISVLKAECPIMVLKQNTGKDESLIYHENTGFI